MSDWTDAVAQADTALDKTELKRDVDLRAVCERELGILFDDYNADCPFHNDDGMHLSVWGDDSSQVGCWVCEWRGDIFDVIMYARGVKFREALRIASRYRDDGIVADAGLIPSPSLTSPEAWQIIISAAQTNASVNPTPIVNFVHEKGLRVSASWLRLEWLVGSRGESIMIPHYNRHGIPMGYKERTASTIPISAKGARFTDLYGSWRDHGHHQVIVCEGETDTWTVAKMVINYEIDVFGLPTGAGSAPRESIVDLLHDRDLLLAFDNDEAGRRATERWKATFPDSSVLRLPDEADCSSIEPDVLRCLLEEEYGPETKTTVGTDLPLV